MPNLHRKVFTIRADDLAVILRAIGEVDVVALPVDATVAYIIARPETGEVSIAYDHPSFPEVGRGESPTSFYIYAHKLALAEQAKWMMKNGSNDSVKKESQ